MLIPNKLFTSTSLRFVLLLQKSEDLLLSQFSKPKQKRHRCRNPNKIDINTLTGEERVPVVNRRNGRKVTSSFQNIDSTCCIQYVVLVKVVFFKSLSFYINWSSKKTLHLPVPQMGGAMAPPMKELPRWLLENPEFSIAPDWTEIVKQSVSYQGKSYK